MVSGPLTAELRPLRDVHPVQMYPVQPGSGWVCDHGKDTGLTSPLPPGQLTLPSTPYSLGPSPGTVPAAAAARRKLVSWCPQVWFPPIHPPTWTWVQQWWQLTALGNRCSTPPQPTQLLPWALPPATPPQLRVLPKLRVCLWPCHPKSALSRLTPEIKTQDPPLLQPPCPLGTQGPGT